MEFDRSVTVRANGTWACICNKTSTPGWGASWKMQAEGCKNRGKRRDRAWSETQSSPLINTDDTDQKIGKVKKKTFNADDRGW